MLYFNSNIPEKRVRMILSKEIAELPEDSTYIYKRNMMNRYIIRSHDALLEQICYALFIKRYQLQTKPVENDSKSEKLVDELVETNQSTSSSYPKLLILRQIELVLWYMSLINLKIQKAMYITYFLSFYPFRDDCELKLGQPPSYSSKLNKHGVLDMVN